MSALLDKNEVIEMVKQLPEGATFEDLAYQIYVRQAIEEGIADADVGRVFDSSEVRARFGLSA